MESLISRLTRITRRSWADRVLYATTSCWLLGIYNRILIHLPAAPLPGRGKIVSVRLKGIDDPLLVRLATTDWYAMEDVFRQQEYQPVAVALSNVASILDLGMNVGMSVRLWQILWPGAKIVGVEPDAGNLQMAERNLIQGHGPSPVLVRACVAGKPRIVHLDRRGGEYGFEMSEGPAEGEEIEAITVPQVCQRANLNGTIDLLKCDVEGAEAEIFADCRQWIGRVRHMMVELHHPYTVEKFRDDLLHGGAELERFDATIKGSMALVFLTLRPPGDCAMVASDKNPGISAMR